MGKNIYTLNSLRKNSQDKNFHTKNNFDLRARIVISSLYAISVSLIESVEAFLLAAVLPLIIIFFVSRNGIKTILKINFLNLIMILTMLFTFPSFNYALKMSAIITLRMNYICIIFVKLFEAMNDEGFYYLPFRIIPEKMQILIILTIRGIFILHEHLQSALLSVRLRAANLKGFNNKWKVFAYVIASSLLKSSAESEKIFLAVKCRGGFQGFKQSKELKWKFSDSIFCVILVIYISEIIILS